MNKEQIIMNWIESKKLNEDLLALAKLKLKLETYFEDVNEGVGILDDMVVVGVKCNDEHSVHIAKLIMEHFAGMEAEETIDVAKKVYEYIGSIKIPLDYMVVARLMLEQEEKND